MTVVNLWFRELERPVDVGGCDALDGGVDFQVLPDRDVGPKSVVLWAITQRLERFRLVWHHVMTGYLNL